MRTVKGRKLKSECNLFLFSIHIWVISGLTAPLVVKQGAPDTSASCEGSGSPGGSPCIGIQTTVSKPTLLHTVPLSLTNRWGATANSFSRTLSKAWGSRALLNLEDSNPDDDNSPPIKCSPPPPYKHREFTVTFSPPPPDVTRLPGGQPPPPSTSQPPPSLVPEPPQGTNGGTVRPSDDQDWLDGIVERPIAPPPPEVPVGAFPATQEVAVFAIGEPTGLPGSQIGPPATSLQLEAAGFKQLPQENGTCPHEDFSTMVQRRAPPPPPLASQLSPTPDDEGPPMRTDPSDTLIGGALGGNSGGGFNPMSLMYSSVGLSVPSPSPQPDPSRPDPDHPQTAESAPARTLAPGGMSPLSPPNSGGAQMANNSTSEEVASGHVSANLMAPPGSAHLPAADIEHNTTTQGDSAAPKTDGGNATAQGTRRRLQEMFQRLASPSGEFRIAIQLQSREANFGRGEEGGNASDVRVGIEPLALGIVDVGQLVAGTRQPVLQGKQVSAMHLSELQDIRGTRRQLLQQPDVRTRTGRGTPPPPGSLCSYGDPYRKAGAGGCCQVCRQANARYNYYRESDLDANVCCLAIAADLDQNGRPKPRTLLDVCCTSPVEPTFLA